MFLNPKKKNNYYKACLCIVGFTLMGHQASFGKGEQETSFGKYQNKKGQIYSQYKRVSKYAPTSDGTLLSVDIFRPSVQGKLVEKPLPVIFYYGRYLRAKQLKNGTIMTNLGPWQKGQNVGSLTDRDSSGRLIYWDTGRESIVNLMRHGYIFVRAESRGTGASEGIRDGDHSLTEAKDGADLIDWISKQPWSNGKVGMIGGSYPGMTQLKISALAPPALKAIFPAVPSFDFYQLTSGGQGILHKAILSFMAGQANNDGLGKTQNFSATVPVDSDEGGEELAKIIQNRKKNSPKNAVMAGIIDSAPELAATLGMMQKELGLRSIMQTLSLLMSPPHLQQVLKGKPELQNKIARGLHLYRDTPAFSKSRARGMVSPHTVLAGMNKAAIPTYIWTGWYDQDTVGAFQLFHNLKGPKKITSGLWSHGPNEDNGKSDNPLDAYEAEARELLNSEALRWFDHWLKGIDTGMMSEEDVHYGYQNKDGRLKWRTANNWPLPAAKTETYFLTSKKENNDPKDDGGLISSPAKKGKISFTIDYMKTMGMQSRFHDAMSGAPAMLYPDMQTHAAGEGALTFTTSPLKEDKLLVGHAEVTLFAKSTAVDGDLFAYLEEIDEKGYATYLTEALVRASHGRVGDLSYDTFGVPFSLSSRASVAQVVAFNQGVSKLTFSFQPTANLFEKGHKIRLVVTGADLHNYMSPVFSPSPKITVYMGSGKASHIKLPMMAIK